MLRFRDQTVLTGLAEIANHAHTAVVSYDTLSGTALRAARGEVDEEQRALIARWGRLLTAARSAGVPVVFVRHAHIPDWWSGAWLRYRMKTAVPGTILAEPDQLPDLRAPEVFRNIGCNPRIAATVFENIVAELKPAETDLVLEKYFNSAFSGTPLAQLLHNRGVKTIVLTGGAAESGIEISCREALVHGFYVVVPRDCVRPRDPTQYESALHRMAQSAELCTLADLLDAWGSTVADGQLAGASG